MAKAPVKAGKKKSFKKKEKRDLSSAPFPVTRFILFESRLSRHGAHYEEVASYSLG